MCCMQNDILNKVVREGSHLHDVIWRHAHEEDGSFVGVDVAVHPLCPRLEHLPVSDRTVHQRVLAPTLFRMLMMTTVTTFPVSLLFIIIIMMSSSSTIVKYFFLSSHGEWNGQVRSRVLYSHDFHLEVVEPPDVCVEDEVVDALPVLGVVCYGAPGDDAVHDAVHLRVVRVGLHQEGRPVELHRRVVVLWIGGI
jgi:hypothetical protein